MGALSFLRIARRIPGLGKQKELPQLEALLEAEGERPHAVYRILKIVIPSSIALFGGVSCWFAQWSGAGTVSVVIGSLSTALLAAASWTIFHLLDRSIPETTRQLRRRCEKLLHRYQSFANLTGVEPALDSQVAVALDEAAGIYLKHTAAEPKGLTQASIEARNNAVKALESGMAHLLELSEHQRPLQQRQALEAGWAESILAEMREVDHALDQHARNSELALGGNEALAGLREARYGLLSIDQAIEELNNELRH